MFFGSHFLNLGFSKIITFSNNKIDPKQRYIQISHICVKDYVSATMTSMMSEQPNTNDNSSPIVLTDAADPNGEKPEAAVEKPSNTTSTTTMKKDNSSQNDNYSKTPCHRSKHDMFSPRLETTLRITMAAFLAYCLSYAHLPKIIPPSQQFLVGLFGSIIPMRIPNYCWSLGAMLSVLYFVVIFGMASVTMIWVAGTISDGMFVLVASVWALWISGLRYGFAGKGTYILPGVLVVLIGILGVGLQPVIRDGVHITIEPGLLKFLVGQLLEEKGVTIEQVRAAIRVKLLEVIPENLLPYIPTIIEAVKEYVWDRLQELQELVENSPGVTFTIPFGDLAGREATVDLQGDGSLEIDLHVGGTWLIKQLWTQSGTENTLAVMQNFLVVASWAFLCTFTTPFLLVPWRTLRHDITTLILPTALRDAAAFLQDNLDYMRNFNTVTDKKNDDDNQETHSKEFDNRLLEWHSQQESLQKTSGVIHGGSMGLITIFEPRLLRIGKPIELTAVKLKNLLSSAEKAISLSAMNATFHTSFNKNRHLLGPSNVETYLERTIATYESCAQAIETRHHMPVSDGEEAALVDTSKTESTASVNLPYEYEILLASRQLSDQTEEWVESMDPAKSPSRATFKNLAASLLVYSLPPMAVAARLVEIFLYPFLIGTKKQRLDWGKLFHCIKFALGFAGLLCCSLYWDNYRDFDVNDENEEQTEKTEVGDFVTIRSIAPDSFAGWNLIAYAFATMPTTEGTIKKCVLRLLGTLAGAFSAWLALLASSDNEYGMVAWLTVTTFGATYFAVDDDIIESRMGTSKDTGYGGFYFVLTQSVICMEFLAGFGSRNDLVANRVVANIAGILTATVMAIIPPAIHGGDPYRARFMLHELHNGLEQFVELLLSPSCTTDAIVALETKASKAFDKERSDVLYLMEDAQRLSKFPMYKVDPWLEQTITRMTSTSSFLSAVMLSTARDLDSIRMEDARAKLQEILEHLGGNASSLQPNNDNEIHDADDGETEHSKNQAKLRTEALQLIAKKIKLHEEDLSLVSWGWRGTW
mmetsp:Transcript_16244/g.35628  ORF Transcript_16244/g.35628 Transcript_16244/m.35628 type:complete len:1040 (-) Transcript_16244:188-3307(-)